ncbi:hypothetical protein OIY81_245 [Cryptosporidium canis]|uniref:Uncharacterized protein n=1 Tax=Cryptosporidium canis TaxID=195482 RepID=A0ABQ8P2F3_9CRYT|nr:hypothetical protein OJ252_3406 [Cryptosporidium canis]KAJ1614812.1 hypothetical protein OIY81_245 [Cryptosporidium canis]
MRNESVNRRKLDSIERDLDTNENLQESDTNVVLEETIQTSNKKSQKTGTGITLRSSKRISESESMSEDGGAQVGFSDEVILKAVTLRKRKQEAESGSKIRRVDGGTTDENTSVQNNIFTERPFFQRLTDTIYRRLIIGSSNQIKLVGLISAARLLVHLYESNTLEIPQNEEVQYKIPLLKCHVGDWQPMDSDKVVLANSNISKDILECSKTPHAPPLVNRTRNIYIVTPLNYDGNKVGGGYRGGGSDPLSRLVMKWRNLSVSDVQDFTYITENGFDLKYNGFYILYAKSNKPNSQWKQFYSARMRTNTFNSRHKILINSTHLSKLIKLHTVHLQKDGTDLPIGMALFEDHTESLATEDIRRDQTTSSAADLNNANSYDNRLSNGADKNSNNGPDQDESTNNSLDSNKDMDSNKVASAFNGSTSSSSQAMDQLNKDSHISGVENGQAQANNASAGMIYGSNIPNQGLLPDQNSIFSQGNISYPGANSAFAKDSVELSLLYSFRLLNPKIQSEILHAMSCIRFLNQDLFSAALRSALDAVCMNNNFPETGFISPKVFGLLQAPPSTQNVFDRTKNDPLFIRLLQDGMTESALSSGYNSICQDSFISSNDFNKTAFAGYPGMESMNIGFPSNTLGSFLPMFWSSFLTANPFTNPQNFTADKDLGKINTMDSNSSAFDPNINGIDNQNETQATVISTPVRKPAEN